MVPDQNSCPCQIYCTFLHFCQERLLPKRLHRYLIVNMHLHWEQLAAVCVFLKIQEKTLLHLHSISTNSHKSSVSNMQHHKSAAFRVSTIFFKINSIYTYKNNKKRGSAQVGQLLPAGVWPRIHATSTWHGWTDCPISTFRHLPVHPGLSLPNTHYITWHGRLMEILIKCKTDSCVPRSCIWWVSRCIKLFMMWHFSCYEESFYSNISFTDSKLCCNDNILCWLSLECFAITTMQA